MCGICGKFNLDGSPIQKELIRGMIGSMRHRGPDAQDVYVAPGIGLGHCRLSIIDLSPFAQQPMSDSYGHFIIVYNGEVYNFIDLKKELRGSGIRFRSSSDTEVVLEAYRRWGAACLDKFHGMFALAIWDSKKEELFLARDRFGVKPLYYFVSHRTFSFASEIQVLLKDRDCTTALNLQGVNIYLAFNYIPGQQTIYKEIKKLEPGHFLRISRNGMEIQKWYDLPSRLEEKTSPPDFNSACEQIRYRLEKAVEKRLVSDVPLGAFLSGGIDSSLVVALMAKHSSRPIKTFTIGYKNHTMYDETSYAKLIARKFGTDHKEFLLSHNDILRIIPTLLDSMGEPFGDPSLLPTFILSYHTRQHVTVALSGDAGDEVFAGYRKYAGEFFARYYLRLPSFLRSRVLPSLVDVLPSSRNSFLMDNIRQMKKFIHGISGEQYERHHRWMEIFNRETRESILKERGLATCEDTMSIVRKIQDQWLHSDTINKMLFTDLGCCLPHNMFYKVDIASMLNSLEVRSPFIDHELVEQVFRLPGSYKLRATRRKHILLEAYSDLIPRKIRTRRKHGFDVPIGEWFRKELKDLFHDIVFDRNDHLFDSNAVRKIYDTHANRHEDHSFPLWNLFVLKWWLNRGNYASS